MGIFTEPRAVAMVRYVTFLRAINVDGQKLIKMDVLRAVFESLRLKK